MLGGSCSQVEPCSPQGRTWGSGQDHSSLWWQCSLQVPAHFGLARSMTVFCLDFFSDSFVCISTTAARCLMPATGAAPLTGLPAPSVSGPDWPAVPRCLAMHFWLSHLIKLFKPRAPMGESGGNAGPGCFNWLLACVHTCIAASAESSRAITDGQGVKMYSCVAKRSLPWKLCNWGSVGSTPKIRILPFFYCRASLPPPSFLPVSFSRIGPTNVWMGMRRLLLHFPVVSACRLLSDRQEPSSSSSLGSPWHHAPPETLSLCRTAGRCRCPAMPMNVCTHDIPQPRCHWVVWPWVLLSESNGAGAAAPGWGLTAHVALSQREREKRAMWQPPILLSIKWESRKIQKALRLLAIRKLVRWLLFLCSHLKSCPSALLVH